MLERARVERSGAAVPLGFAVLLASRVAFAQTIALPPAAVDTDRALAEAMPAVAKQAIALYSDPDRSVYLNTLFRLQNVAGQYREAAETVDALIEARRSTSPATAVPLLPFEILARARAAQASGGIAFDEAFTRAFGDTFGKLDDAAASDAQPWFRGDIGRMREDLRGAVDKQKGRDGIALADALDLVRKYFFYHAFLDMTPLMAALASEDDERRYVLDRDVLIETPDGARVAAIVVRPRAAQQPLPTLMLFTIYANDDWSLDEARRTAAHGYAGVTAYSRGKGRSPDTPVPYEYDGEDARTVINWIASQPWSDGRVGMFGGSYTAFAQWAAAKRLPRALKALMPSATNAPGIDTPMQGNVFLNFVYPWGPYVTDKKGLDEERYGDQAHWAALNRAWYTTGRPYRDLERIDGRPNPVFDRWLQHPSYDGYWQRLIPYRREFALIDIPVLTTTGYFDGGQVGALYTFTEHTKYNPRADHTLLIGPYDHFGAQRRPAETLQGYTIDPVARINIRDLRYQWFDFVFKGSARPDLLRDRVNYEVMGANEWRHAPSVEAMSTARRRLHLGTRREGDTYRMSPKESERGGFIEQTVNFADRSDVDARISTEIVDKRLDASNSLVFVSEPFEQPTTISGLFSGRLDFVTNKKDLDVEVDLYEKMPGGEYMQLTVTPAYLVRVSYAGNRSKRRLLSPGKRQALAFRSERLTSRRLGAGSRLVLVVGVVKSPEMQINYGTGKDVSDESIGDANVPLRIKWFGSSFVEIPLPN